jgi:hypothetical protein
MADAHRPFAGGGMPLASCTVSGSLSEWRCSLLPSSRVARCPFAGLDALALIEKDRRHLDRSEVSQSEAPRDEVIVSAHYFARLGEKPAV